MGVRCGRPIRRITIIAYKWYLFTKSISKISTISGPVSANGLVYIPIFIGKIA